jgi:hypothetical protein
MPETLSNNPISKLNKEAIMAMIKEVNERIDGKKNSVFVDCLKR